MSSQPSLNLSLGLPYFKQEAIVDFKDLETKEWWKTELNEKDDKKFKIFRDNSKTIYIILCRDILRGGGPQPPGNLSYPNSRKWDRSAEIIKHLLLNICIFPGI